MVTPSTKLPAFHLGPYVQMVRVDHWFKNAFMLLGVVLAVFYEPEPAAPGRACWPLCCRVAAPPASSRRATTC